MVKKIKICMLGYYGVGKTSLVARYVTSMYSGNYQTTVGVKVDKKELNVEGQDVALMLWDVAGEEDDAAVNLRNVRGALGYLLVVDGKRGKTLEVALSIQQRVENEYGPLPFLVLVNKVDERPSWEVTDAAIEGLAARGWTVLETSAKEDVNVEEAFLALSKGILTAQAEDDGEDDD
jgi:small GTP-binding protein